MNRQPPIALTSPRCYGSGADGRPRKKAAKKLIDVAPALRDEAELGPRPAPVPVCDLLRSWLLRAQDDEADRVLPSSTGVGTVCKCWSQGLRLIA